MKKKWILVILAAVMAILSACGKEEVKPRAIKDTDTCEVCNMAVADDQHATQIVLENGKSLIFDDLGCMYTWLKENENEKIAGKFVRDYDDKEWINSEDATYVYSLEAKTPMAYHVISFKDKKDAERFTKEHEGSKEMTAKDLAGFNWDQNKEGHQEQGADPVEDGSK